MSADPFDVFEREGWRRGRAAPYHRGLGPLTSRAVEPLLDAAGVGAGSAVLDVAGGPGYVAATAAGRGARVVGTDLSPEMVDLAAGLHPEIEFQVAGGDELPFEDGYFDAVVAGFLMPHVADLPAVVAEMARVLRPGGRVALSTWDPDAPGFLRSLMEAIAAAGATPPADLPPGPDFFQFARDDAFGGLLEGAGLADPDVRAHAFTQRIADTDRFFAELVEGTVRMNALITGQTPKVQDRIRSEYLERLAAWDSEIPYGVKIGSAARV